jgi:hypothetical protein
MSYPKIETPRGTIIVNSKGEAELKWSTTFRQKWQKRYSAAQEHVDHEVLRLSEQYVPKRTGMLILSGVLGTFVGSGEVAWIAPYAKAQYYSSRKPGSQKGPLRGPYWFQRGKAVWGRKLIADARRIAGGGK